MPLPTDQPATIGPATAEKEDVYDFSDRGVAAAAHALPALFDEVEGLAFPNVESGVTIVEGTVRVAAASHEVQACVFHIAREIRGGGGSRGKDWRD